MGVTGEVESSCSVNYHLNPLVASHRTFLTAGKRWIHPTLPLPMPFVTSFGKLLETMASNMTPWHLAYLKSLACECAYRGVTNSLVLWTFLCFPYFCICQTRCWPKALLSKYALVSKVSAQEYKTEETELEETCSGGDYMERIARIPLGSGKTLQQLPCLTCSSDFTGNRSCDWSWCWAKMKMWSNKLFLHYQCQEPCCRLGQWKL